MTHHYHIPIHPLNRFIASFTYYKGYTPGYSINRYLPDGNIEIIIDLTAEPKYIYDNTTLRHKQECKNVWISGIRNNYITIPSGLNAEMFIIEFKKGMAYSFTGMPLTEITEQVINADLLPLKTFTQLREILLNTVQPAEMFSIAEKLLLARFGSRLIENPFVYFAVNKMLTSPSALTIKSIAGKTGYSAKHFIKIFSDNVGVTPKLFMRIMRFQKAIGEMEIQNTVNWAGLALDCGYYDQAHFIADFKKFSGFTPVEYHKAKNIAYPNYVPVE